MAKKDKSQSNSIETRSFNKGMMKDIDDSLMPEGGYKHARNLVNNSKEGDIGIVGNEPANYACVKAPYTIIGTIHIISDKWAIFSTDNIDSEIGLFDDSQCTYEKIVNDQCLNFDKANPILGTAKEIFDCTFQLYWADALNPDRTMNVENPPYICIDTPVEGSEDCFECISTGELDCEAIRIARLTKQPCIRLEESINGGQLRNGSYQAYIAYSKNEQRMTDYSMPSNVQPIFDHRDVNGSLDLVIEDIDDTYDEFELIIVSVINSQTVAKKIGNYSTKSSRINIDHITTSLENIETYFLNQKTPNYEKSEGLYKFADALVRVAPTTRLDFNYQPRANEIVTKWVEVEYPKNYYNQGGYVTSYMRDEVYSFFIRWIYNTGDRSASYHIPGRPPDYYSLPGGGQGFETATTVSNVYFGEDESIFEIYNTAGSGAALTGTTTDGGIIKYTGKMGYWQSTEKYPDDKPDVWGNLCGKNIRHHKMPDHRTSYHFNPVNKKINVLGVKFTNIKAPVENPNDPLPDQIIIPGIIGYEILRGSREGQKTVIAKGIVNNMAEYDLYDLNGDVIPNRKGLYQNYPYNDLRTDPYLANKLINNSLTNAQITCIDEPFETSNNCDLLGGDRYQHNFLSFHSPDTSFKNPFLSQQELKLYCELEGTSKGYFNDVNGHPKHKILRTKAYIVAGFVGFGIAILARKGEEKRTISYPKLNITAPNPATTAFTPPIPYTSSFSDALIAAAVVPLTGGLALQNSLITGNDAIRNTLAWQLAEIAASGTPGTTQGRGAETTGSNALNFFPGIDGGTTTVEFYPDGKTGMPPLMKAVQGIPTFLAYWGENTDNMLEIIRRFVKWRQYALSFQSKCFYDDIFLDSNKNLRYKIEDSRFVKDNLQEFADEYTINNLHRGSYVGIKIDSGPGNSIEAESPWEYSGHTDDTRQIVGTTSEIDYNKPYSEFDRESHVMYGALKTRIRNQYGQLDGVIQVPASYCKNDFEYSFGANTIVESNIIFGGDTYINRYTEKNSMFFFHDWMYNIPDGTQWDYRNVINIPFPTYWMDTLKVDVGDIIANLGNAFGTSNFQSTFPGDYYHFDGNILNTALGIINPTMGIKKSYMYLFNSGVRDFYVESEVNVGLRDWDEQKAERFYDPYNYVDLKLLFDTDIIAAGNFHKYDYSLSISRLYQEFKSWGFVQGTDYDPEIAKSCYLYYPKRLIYSMPSYLEDKYDYWLDFKVNNYRDFNSKVTSVKAISNAGGMVLFEDASPLMFNAQDAWKYGNDSLSTILIGNGSLFDQPSQSVVNADDSYEYGSCQNRWSVINTPAGLFWISQNQGKIFNFTNQLSDISQINMKWWFEEFLPYKILEDFPNYDLLDNNVIGVGCQSMYDNSNNLVYFTKRDFRLAERYRPIPGEAQSIEDAVTYQGDNSFLYKGYKFDFGDPQFFVDASWTVSYDTKTKAWVSFHDWHPSFMLPSKKNFMTILDDGIWKHNDTTDIYCNYYDIDYPFEIDIVVPTGQTVNSLKSIEYQMECYKSTDLDVNKFHVLDYNFDRAYIYNTEQISGELRLNLQPKNDPVGRTQYPVVNPTSIDILYSKEEQKYRFNQFWDITDDRGEFFNPTIPGFAERPIWLTEDNGYIMNLNPVNLNYNKSLFQRKKFRHYTNVVKMKRSTGGRRDIGMRFRLINFKNQYSPR